MAEQRKAQKHKARQMPGFVHLLSDRLYSRPTDFIVSDHIPSPARFALRRGGDLVDAQVRPLVFLFLIEAQAENQLQRAVDRKTAGQRDGDAENGHHQLRHEGDAAGAAQGLAAEDPGGNPAPGAADAVQRPDAEHVVDLPAILGQREHDDEQRTGDGANDQRPHRVHQVGAGADGHQAGERAVMDEARVVLAQHQRRQNAADHGHKRVDGDQPGDVLDRLRAHDVEAEPANRQDPGAQGQERNG